MKLFCPGESTDWSSTLQTDREKQLVRDIASRLSLAYREDKTADKTFLGRKSSTPATLSTGINLHVPMFQQWDSNTTQGERMCFSSSLSMCVEYLSPGLIKKKAKEILGYSDQKIAASQTDDLWLLILNSFGGDTTAANNQTALLHRMGFTSAHLVTDADMDTLISQLSKNKPIPVGFFHHGPPSNPDRSRSHWAVVRGITTDRKRLILNDPAGQLDNGGNGGYHIDNNGTAVEYSWDNFKQRWSADGTHTGWAILL